MSRNATITPSTILKLRGSSSPKNRNGTATRTGKAIDDNTGKNNCSRPTVIRIAKATTMAAIPRKARPATRDGERGMGSDSFCTAMSLHLFVYTPTQQPRWPEDQDEDQDREGENVAVSGAQRREIGQQRRKERLDKAQQDPAEQRARNIANAAEHRRRKRLQAGNKANVRSNVGRIQPK